MAGLQALCFGDFHLGPQMKTKFRRSQSYSAAGPRPGCGLTPRRAAPQGHNPPARANPGKTGLASDYLPALNAVNTRVWTRRIGCGTLSGAVMIFLSASLRKIEVFSATSFLTNFSEAAFGLA